MSEFEPCPVTGLVPIIGYGGGVYLSFQCPMTGAAISFSCDSSGECHEFWEQYLPAARKYAELLEAEKPVEFQVGDEVTLSESGWKFIAIRGHRAISQETTEVFGVDGGEILLKGAFYQGDDGRWGAEKLLLISRPKNLTVKDLPEQDCIQVVLDKNGLWWLSVDGLYRESFGLENEAVAAAIGVCNKIADAVNKKREESK